MSKILQIPITDLNLEPGEHEIQVSADSSTSTESALSNRVGKIKITTTLQAPNLYIYDSILYFLLVPYATSDKFTYTIFGEHHWTDEEGKEQYEEVTIATLKPKSDSMILTANLKSIKDDSGKLVVQPGIWFISVNVTCDEGQEIYKNSPDSNYIFYLAKIPLDPPTDLAIGTLSGSTVLYLTPSKLGEKYNERYRVYLDKKAKRVLTINYDSTAEKYYLSLSELGALSKTYTLQVSTVPTAAQEDVYTSSALSDSIIWVNGDYEILTVKETDESENYIYLKDSTGNFMCVIPIKMFYYLSQKQAREFKKELINLLEFCRYRK